MGEPNWGPGGPPPKVNVFRKEYRKLSEAEQA